MSIALPAANSTVRRPPPSSSSPCSCSAWLSSAASTCTMEPMASWMVSCRGTLGPAPSDVGRFIEPVTSSSSIGSFSTSRPCCEASVRE